MYILLMENRDQPGQKKALIEIFFGVKIRAMDNGAGKHVGYSNLGLVSNMSCWEHLVGG